MSVAAAMTAFVKPSMTIALQPIVALNGEHVFAYEALARFGGGADTSTMFKNEAERGSTELNVLAMQKAIASARNLSGSMQLFLNIDPMALASSEFAGAVLEAARRRGVATNRLVLEITERAPLEDVTASARTLSDLHRHGVRFALDDFGSGHSHLAHVDLIRPAFLKIGHGFGSGFQESETRTAIVRHMAALARDLKADTVLEGVETADTAAAARELGIRCAQGYHFGRPSLPSRNRSSLLQLVRADA